MEIESQSRRDNILIDGIKETENEDCSKNVQEVFKNIMNLENIAEMKIVRCHSLGVKRRESHKPRTIIIKFHLFGDRSTVWQARKQLKGSMRISPRKYRISGTSCGPLYRELESYRSEHS